MKITNKIINNVPVTFIKTKKFKSIVGALYFKCPVTKEKMTTRKLLGSVLIDSCKKYETSEKLTLNCLQNYDAYYSSNACRIGNYFYNIFKFETLEDEYTEDGNLEKVIDTFCEIVFNPNVESDEFNKESFDIKVKRLKQSYERTTENQRAYAERRILKHLNKNKAYSYDFDIDILNSISQSSLYKEYKDMINNSSVSLIIVGNVDENDTLYEKITNKIKLNVNYDLELYISNDDEKQEEKIKRDVSNGTQNVLQIVCFLKNMSNYELNYVMPIYSNILGGGATSRLFNSVREENSLAYYCFSRYEKDDNILQIITGIEKENFQKAVDIIKKELKNMDKITDEEIQMSKKELSSSLIESQDNIFNVMGRKHNEQLFSLPNIDEFLDKLNKVKKEDVEKINKKIELSIIYFLQGSDNNG